MGPNSAQLVRVYTRETGGPVADATLNTTADFEVVVEAEAGAAVFGSGAQFQTGLLIKDLTDNTNIPFSPAPASGALKIDWPTQGYAFVYKVAKAALAGRAGHLIQVHAFLLIGLQDFDASQVSSPIALLLP